MSLILRIVSKRVAWSCKALLVWVLWWRPMWLFTWLRVCIGKFLYFRHLIPVLVVFFNYFLFFGVSLKLIVCVEESIGVKYNYFQNSSSCATWSFILGNLSCLSISFDILWMRPHIRIVEIYQSEKLGRVKISGRYIANLPRY